MHHRTKSVLVLNLYVLYSDQLLIGSNPEVLPEFYYLCWYLTKVLSAFFLLCVTAQNQEKWITGLGH